MANPTHQPVLDFRYVSHTIDALVTMIVNARKAGVIVDRSGAMIVYGSMARGMRALCEAYDIRTNVNTQEQLALGARVERLMSGANSDSGPLNEK
jgi:hypothetical protein